MPLGPIFGALAGGIASAGASTLAGKLFGGGGGNSLGTPQVAGINAGGLTSSFKNGTSSVTASPARSALVGNIASTYGPQADIYGSLRKSVTPGFSALRAARLAALESSRQQAVGDLRDNLARRRVLGSSFAQDALTRADLSYAQQADQITSDSFLQELQLTQQLTQAEFDARRSQFQTGLDELNLEANAATQLASGATAQLGDNARLKAQLDSQAAAGAGQFFGQAFAPVGTAINKAVTNFFSPTSPNTIAGAQGAPFSIA